MKRILLFLFASCLVLGLACSSPETKNPPEQEKEKSVPSKEGAEKKPKSSTTKTKPEIQSAAKGAESPEDLVKRFPEAIGHTKNYAALLPDEALLKSVMTCTGKHPLVEMLKKAHGLMAKNVQSAKAELDSAESFTTGLKYEILKRFLLVRLIKDALQKLIWRSKH